MAGIEIMAEAATGIAEVTPAGQQASPASAPLNLEIQVGPITEVQKSITQVKPPREKVLENAALSDEKRAPAAEAFLKEQKLLDRSLTPEQLQGILDIHKVGEQQPGQAGGEAHVYNYRFSQIREKAKKLAALGFNEAQRRALMEWGYVGALPSSEFATLNPDTINDLKLKRIGNGIKTRGDAGNVDEVFIHKTIAQIRRLSEAAEVDPVEGDALVGQLEGWLAKADDKWLPQAERARLREMANREGGSVFSMAKHEYEYYMAAPLPAANLDRQELLDRREAARIEVQNLINQADQAGLLENARKKGLDFYKQLKVAKRQDKWGYDKEKLIELSRQQGYHEAFWGDSPELKQLEGVFKGAATYLYDGVVSEAYKEMNDTGGEPALNVVAKKEFHDIREQRRRDRLSKDKKYEVNNYYGRRSYELTAENSAELPSAILEWVRDQLAELPDTDMQTVDGKLKEIRAEAEQLLGTNRVHLEKDERLDVPETHPDFLKAKAAFEAVTESIGYEKIISWDEKVAHEGGGEVAASYAERFASNNYIGHHDAVYLMRRVARILLELRTHKEGTYWTGHPFSEEKVDLGYMRKYRQQLQKEITEDAATHDIFTETIFTENQDLFQDLIRTQEDKDDVKLGYVGFFELREKYKLQYSRNDPLERMLLDPGDVIRQKIIATGDAEALSRHDARVQVFRDIKVSRDTEDGLAGLSPEQRINAVRQRVNRQMRSEMNNSLCAEINQKASIDMEAARSQNDPIAYDKAMWKWVEDYNKYRAKAGFHIEGDASWYPTGWDMVRMKIDIAEKVLDRKLTDEQIDAMYEKNQSAAGGNLTDYKTGLALDEARFGFQVARGYGMLEMEDAMYGGIRTRIRDSKTGEIIDPSHKVRRIFDIVQKRLEKAIAEEEAELNQFRAAKEAEISQAKQAYNFVQAKQLQIELDRKILGAQFLATHALKAAGFVDGKLPAQDGQLKSDSVINFFGEILAAYGVNVAFAEKISHNSKDLLYEIINRGTRAWQSEWDIAAQEYMVGTYPVSEQDYDINPNSPTYGQLVPQFDAQGNAIKAKAYQENAYGEEVTISEKNRIVNTGAPSEHQGITDNRFNSSTSGGLAVPEFTDELGDLLFTPPLAKLGVVSIAGLHGYIKGWDEVEASRQKIFTNNDAVYSAKERVAAYNAIKAFMGGKYGENKSGPGFANEPFEGAFKAADWLQKFLEEAKKHKLSNTYNYVALMQQGYRAAGKDYKDYSEFTDKWLGTIKGLDASGNMVDIKVAKGGLERLRQLSYLDLDGMTKTETDELYTTLGGVFNIFQDYLTARKACINSRGGRTLRSAEEGNHKAFYAFRREMREAIQGKKDENGNWVKKPERGFIIRLGYSPEIASEVALRMLEIVLMDSKYLVLTREELPPRVRAGEEILAAGLTDGETREGFQVTENGVTKRTFVIPDEKDWGNIVEDRVRKALVKIRRRGLLQFMREEGYKVYERNNQGVLVNKEKAYQEILGQKLPPLVQEVEVKKDSRKVRSVI